MANCLLGVVENVLDPGPYRWIADRNRKLISVSLDFLIW